MRELNMTLPLSTLCVCMCESQRAIGRSRDRWRCSSEEKAGRANTKTNVFQNLVLQTKLLRL